MKIFNAVILCLFASIQVAIADTSTSILSSCTTQSLTKSVAVVKTITTRRGEYFYASNTFFRPAPTTVTVTLPAKTTIFTTTQTTVPAAIKARATDPVVIGVDEASKKPRSLPDDASRGISFPRILPNRFNFRSLSAKAMYPYAVYCVYEIRRVSITTVTDYHPKIHNDDGNSNCNGITATFFQVCMLATSPVIERDARSRYFTTVAIASRPQVMR
ncbi:uncharacterized protein Bfra_004080 [Botrytis fragariae]|uniref:Uncharacterized protein n=1 Tax=Botrytis fragariae TaxID=1964551 RepID=A0A8H6AUJ8_9HELO|nr:uncharacterized protein Bfra_004080 [Botrytis fragariae]KAF5874073.1 hypothetical protein Bfra_004080 [Botrytis fragariae]